MSTFVARVRRSLRGCRFRFGLGLDLFESGFCLDLFGFLIALPFLDRWRYVPEELVDAWGFRYFGRSIHFRWGRRCKIVRMPWDYEHFRHEVLRPDGAWVPYVASYEARPEGDARETSVLGKPWKVPDGRQTESFPYRYVLRSGEVQERTATVYVDRREWRQLWLRWCPWFAVRRQSIDVSFDGEVGEETGSWKGGTVGCGYDMLPGETAEQTLRRMERDRSF